MDDIKISSNRSFGIVFFVVFFLLFLKSKIDACAPVYGLNTPLGRETTPSRKLSSTNLFRIWICAFDEPKSKPWGTIIAALPPSFNILSDNTSPKYLFRVVCIRFFVSSIETDLAKSERFLCSLLYLFTNWLFNYK